MVVRSVPFENSKLLLNGHKMRRVWGQEQKFASGGLDQLLCFFGFVERGIVNDDDGSFFCHRAEAFLQPCVEELSVAGAFKQHRLNKFFADQRSDQTGAGAALSATGAVDFLPSGCSCVVSLRCGCKAAFVDIGKGTTLRFKSGPCCDVFAALLFISRSLNVRPRFFYAPVSSSRKRTRSHCG